MLTQNTIGLGEVRVSSYNFRTLLRSFSEIEILAPAFWCGMGRKNALV